MILTATVICVLAQILTTTALHPLHPYLIREGDVENDNETPRSVPNLLRREFLRAVNQDKCSRIYANKFYRFAAQLHCQATLDAWTSQPPANQISCSNASVPQCEPTTFWSIWRTERCSFLCQVPEGGTERVFVSNLKKTPSSLSSSSPPSSSPPSSSSSSSSSSSLLRRMSRSRSRRGDDTVSGSPVKIWRQ